MDVHDTDIPDAVPAEEQSAQAPPSPSSIPPADEAADADSPSPSLIPTQSCPLSRNPTRSGLQSPIPINVTRIMALVDGLGLAAAVRFHVRMLLQIRLVRTGRFPSDRAGGDSRRIANKRKDEAITQSAAEDFAMLTCRTTSEHHAADFLSTVTNVI